jgi:hypothetical protein
VTDNPAGRQIVRNGLVAYAIFQDWGNQPGHYTSPAGLALLDAVCTSDTKKTPDVVTNPGVLDEVLRLGSGPFDPARVLIWDYVVRGPQHQILFLDSRTWRGFPAGADEEAPAALIQTTAMNRQFDPGRLDANALTFVISPGPVFGVTLVDKVQDTSSFAGFTVAGGNDEADRERWSYNAMAMDELLRRLVTFSRAVILSGDVHYGFTKEIDFSRDLTGGAQHVRLVQFCCSSLCNQDGKTRALEAVFPANHKAVLLPAPPPPGELGARLERHFEEALAAAAANNEPQDYVNRLYDTYFDIRNRNRLGQAMVITSGSGPAFDQALAIMDAYSTPFAGSWSIKVKGVQGGEVRRLDAQSLAEQPLSDAHRRILKLAGSGSYIVGHNNVGVLRVQVTGADPSSVSQELFWTSEKIIGADNVFALTLSGTLNLTA